MTDMVLFNHKIWIEYTEFFMKPTQWNSKWNGVSLTSLSYQFYGACREEEGFFDGAGWLFGKGY